MEILIKAGGIYCLVLVVFHALFWKIFHWDTALRRLDRLNRAVMQVLNISLTFLFMIIAYVSLAHTDALLTTPLGHALLASIALLWLFRAGQQVVFFGLDHWISWGFLGFFLAGAVIYGLPFVNRN